METSTIEAIFDGGDDKALSAPGPKMEPAPEARSEPQTGELAVAEAPPAPEKEDRPQGDWIPRKAVEDERRKRQELERRVAEYEARLSQTKQDEQPPPDWDIDPRMAGERFQQEVQEQLYRTRVELASDLLRERHADFDDVVNVAVERAKVSPALHRQIVSSLNPAKTAYEIGKKVQFLIEIGDDPSAYRARIEAEIMAKHGIQPAVDGGTLQEAYSPARQAPKAPPAPVPKSLARDVSQQPRATNGQWAGPKPLDEIFGE